MTPEQTTAIIGAAAALGGVLVGGLLQMLTAWLAHRRETVAALRRDVHSLAASVSSYTAALYQALSDAKAYGRDAAYKSHYDRLVNEIGASFKASERACVGLFLCADSRVAREAERLQGNLARFQTKYGDVLMRPDKHEMADFEAERRVIDNRSNVLLTMVEPRVGARVVTFRSAMSAERAMAKQRTRWPDDHPSKRPHLLSGQEDSPSAEDQHVHA